ncbi:tetratricopeptide repeat protein 16 isoform X5 [Homo sapiens]|uniref:tetratricopeptide repeat protein 16 isoform X5 n=1 Tax=Homo sapiens TaxID=9606 RepID=UPI0005D035FA|nr:tetratricopeptide repeat protein 16 isoform X5 [Homo sapiens]|eukprot:XP_011516590.1 tetratricopeptide repeat protein 16 isoform X4 [Homo sapiens]
MTDSDEDALKVDQGPSRDIPKPWVIPAPKGILQHIFGTSHVFQSICDVKPKVTGLTVPLKVREYYSRGQQCLEQADWETAVLLFSRALHLDPQLGQCLFEQCAFLDALNVFSHAAELQPEKPCFRYRCMACLLALKQHQACLTLITNELKQDTTNADVYIFRARLYNFLQKPHLCYRDLHSALLLNPKHPQARMLLQKMVAQAQQARQDAGILAVQGKLQHALQRINRAIENNPLDPSLFLFRGTMYRRLQEFDGAVEDFLKVLDMVTEDQEDMVRQAQRQLLLTYNDFAVHCYRQGAYQEGVLLLNKALRDEQQEKGLYINRGGSSRRQRTTSPRPSGTTPRRPSTTCTGPRAGSCCRTFLGPARMWPLSCSSTPSNQRMLKRHELERQKALALQHSWKQGEPLIATSEELKATPEIPQVKPGSSEGEAEAPEEEEEKEKEKKEEKKSELIPSKVASLSDSYLDQTSSASSMSFRTTGTSETEMSAICQEYRSTSATAVTFSDSSLLKTQSSDSGNNREALSHGPRKIKATQGQRQSLSKTEPTQSQRRNSSKTKATIHKRNSSKTKATQSQRRNSSKTRATQGQGQSSSKTEATQGQRQSSSEIEATQGPRQEPSKTKTTRSPRQRPRKVKAARGRSWRPSKVDATQGRSRGLLRSSTKTEAFYDSNWSLSKTEYAQGQGQRSSKAEGAQGKSQGMSSTSSKAESTWGPSPSLSKTEVDQDLTYYEAV